MASAPLVAIDQVRALSRRLREIARLLPNENPLDPLPRGRAAAPFLFEIKVLVDLLSALKTAGWEIDVERRGKRVRFVRSPAPKSTGSFFRIRKGDLFFQITQGTKIED